MDMVRRAQVECYVAEASQGKPSCLPAAEPMLLPLLRDYISSCGFGLEFVIDAVDDVPLPAACEAMLECCAGVESPSGKGDACYDMVDAFSPASATASTCQPARYPVTQGAQKCAALTGEAGSTIEADDAGATAVSSKYALCCYQTCGFTACI
jgi:hypothetical protein